VSKKCLARSFSSIQVATVTLNIKPTTCITLLQKYSQERLLTLSKTLLTPNLLLSEGISRGRIERDVWKRGCSLKKIFMGYREGGEHDVRSTMMMKVKLNTKVMKTLLRSVKEQELSVLEQWKHKQSQRRDREGSKRFQKRMML
jgi:hypothetical protein